jgi:cytochrome b561
LTATLRPARWNALAIALHWLAGALILFLLAEGWTMAHAGFDAATTFDLYQLHKSFGFVVLALTAARLGGRAAFTAPAAAPSALWEQRLAAFVQASLYALTLAAVLAGWLLVSTSPLPIPTRFFNLFVIPNIAGPDGALFAHATLAHALLAYAIAGLVALHVAGALKHHWIDRDDAVTRMLPRRTLPSPVRERGRG